METAVKTPTSCPVIARGFAAGAVGGVPIGWLVFFTVVAPGDPSVLARDVLLVCGIVGAVIGATVGLLSGVVLAIRETGAGMRTDRSRRIDAAMTSAVPFVLVTVLLASDSARGVVERTRHRCHFRDRRRGSGPVRGERRGPVRVTAPPTRGEIAGRGLFGGAVGGAAIGGAVLFLGSIGPVGLWAAFLATPLGAVAGCILGSVVGSIGGAFLASASRHVVGHDWCARRLAFTTSAAPFLLGLGIARAGIWWWLAAALISGLAGAILAPWVVGGGSLDWRPIGPR
jgi:hypothetical protein